MTKKIRNSFSDVWAKTSGHCAYCGLELSQQYGEENFATIDHIVARVHGGKDEVSNLFLACVNCNSIKGDRGIKRFRALMAKRVFVEWSFSREQIFYLASKGFRLELRPFLFYFEGVKK